VKLNEFKLVESKINELDMSDLIGQYGASGAKVWADKLNPFSKGSGKISVKDKMASEMFVKDFIGRASEDLARAIQGGLVNPKPASASTDASTSTPVDPYSKGSGAGDKRVEPTMGDTPATTPTTTPATTPATTPTTTPTAPTTTPTAPTTTPTAPTAPTSTTPSKITPQQAAALKGRLKGKASPTSAQSGFKNYVGGSGERMTGVDKSGAPIFKHIARESKYSKMNYVFESILEADNQYPDTISSYLQKMFKQYTKGITVDNAIINQVKTIADQAEQNYSSMNPMKRGARQELAKLGNMAYALSYRDSEGYKHGKFSAADTQAGATPTTPAANGELSGLDALRGRSTAASTTPDSTTANTSQAAPTTTAPVSSPEVVKSTYMQVKDLLSKLDKKGKQRILAALQKQLGTEPAPATTTAAPAAEPVTEPTSNAGANAFNQMTRQLPGQNTSSTGGTTTPSATGVTHKAGRGTKVKQTRASKPKTTKKKAAPVTPPVTESKSYKVWGQK